MVYPGSYCAFPLGKLGWGLQCLYHYFLCWCELTNNLIYLLYLPNFYMALTEHTNFIWKQPSVSWDIQVKVPCSFKALSCTTLLPGLGAHICAWQLLAACICAWRHFLGVRLYSNYTIGHRHLERVMCLILPSHLVEFVSSTSIFCCQSFLWECVSRRGLLHYNEGSVFVLR